MKGDFSVTIHYWYVGGSFVGWLWMDISHCSFSLSCAFNWPSSVLAEAMRSILTTFRESSSLDSLRWRFVVSLTFQRQRSSSSERLCCRSCSLVSSWSSLGWLFCSFVWLVLPFSVWFYQQTSHRLVSLRSMEQVGWYFTAKEWQDDSLEKTNYCKLSCRMPLLSLPPRFLTLLGSSYDRLDFLVLGFGFGGDVDVEARYDWVAVLFIWHYH